MIKPDREWILRTPAGPEMDLAVSTVVMGVDTFTPRPYSTDIAAAWEVVERLVDQGWSVQIDCGPGPLGNDPWPWCCTVEGNNRPGCALDGATAPLVICRCALLLTLTEADTASL